MVAFLCYKSVGPLLSPSDDFLPDSQDDDNSEEKEKVISSVISASISSNPPTLYELEKITFTLSHGKVSCLELVKTVVHSVNWNKLWWHYLNYM